jgi:hypothetical protein
MSSHSDCRALMDGSCWYDGYCNPSRAGSQTRGCIREMEQVPVSRGHGVRKMRLPQELQLPQQSKEHGRIRFPGALLAFSQAEAMVRMGLPHWDSTTGRQSSVGMPDAPLSHSVMEAWDPAGRHYVRNHGGCCRSSPSRPRARAPDRPRRWPSGHDVVDEGSKRGKPKGRQ